MVIAPHILAKEYARFVRKCNQNKEYINMFIQKISSAAAESPFHRNPQISLLKFHNFSGNHERTIWTTVIAVKADPVKNKQTNYIDHSSNQELQTAFPKAFRETYEY
jgi:hypothetical protein